MFIRWAHLGVWERLLLLAQERGVQLGMTFLDGTSIRAHPKAAGAEKRGPTAKRAMSARRWAARVAATAPRRERSLMGSDGRWPSSWRRAKPMKIGRASCREGREMV